MKKKIEILMCIFILNSIIVTNNSYAGSYPPIFDDRDHIRRESLMVDVVLYDCSSYLEDDNIIHVPQECDIQSALLSAKTNTTIKISPGIYYGPLVWGAADGIKLIGEDSSTTIIDGGLPEYARGQDPFEMSGININVPLDKHAKIYRVANAEELNLLNLENLSSIRTTAGGNKTSVVIGNISPHYKTYATSKMDPSYLTKVYIQGITIQNFALRGSGGGISCQYVDLNLSDVIIRNNRACDPGNGFAGPPKGGGIYASICNLNFSNVTIERNNSSFAGGGIYINNAAKKPEMLLGIGIKFSNVTISNNYGGVGGCGGAMIKGFFDHISLNSVNCISNSSRSLFGGGGLAIIGQIIYPKTPTIFSNLNIIGNSANYGGGIYTDLPNLFITNSTINKNIANGRVYSVNSGKGGGIFYDSSFSLSLVNVTMAENFAEQSGGAIWGKVSVVMNATIAGNNANGRNQTNQMVGGGIQFTNSRGGIELTNSKALIVNSIFRSNTPYSICVPNSIDNNNKVLIIYSNIENHIEGTNNSNSIYYLDNNIDTDPFFINENQNYYLEANSPCINAGNPDFNNNMINWENDLTDQEPDGTRMDIGRTNQLLQLRDEFKDYFSLRNFIEQHISRVYKYSFKLTEGVNLISLPVKVENKSIGEIFPGFTQAYGISGSNIFRIYENEIIEFGKAYYVIVPEKKIYTVMGEPVNNYQLTVQKNLHTIIPAVLGTTYPKSVPENAIVQMIGMKNNSYFIATEMEAGLAYYVYTSEDAEIIIDNTQSY